MDPFFVPFQELADRIHRIRRGKRVYYRPNYGNWGDGLIRAGTLNFFRDYGIPFREIGDGKASFLTPALRGGTLIYGGGGAWCSVWPDAPRKIHMLERLKRFKILVLPSTYEKNWGNTSAVKYRRDNSMSRLSYPESTFCHDMAFYLLKNTSPDPLGEVDNLYLMREPSERERAKTARILCSTNVDISKKGNHWSAPEGFFDFLRPGKVIHTDRLHVAIAACILGKRVKIYPSNYAKIEAVFEASIKPFFSGASLVNW